ncbi:MAG: RnfABCDGE type electron transport complex subunit D [Candidatus Omnitrophica bacterium]|nr:RnfABCDGE type electron transport complex subunit D [Candidatus Omnitrophota bacterium]
MVSKLTVSVSPHLINRRLFTPQIMWLVTLSLIPAGIISVVIFGLRSLWIVITGCISAALIEAVIQKLRGQKVTISDGSAVLTGLLLAYNLPPDVPLWLVVVGCFMAIAIAKQAFGGLGRNIFNPALVGRVFLLSAWPKYMTTFTKPFDTVTGATPLALMKEGKISDLTQAGINYMDLLIGNRGGCIGEVCAIALILGAIYLFYKKIITWHIPIFYLVTVGIFSWILGSKASLFSGDFIFHILSGGLILGAFFMATDYVTSPLTHKGQIIFGIGCGLFTCVIRFWGGYPEGVSYAILMMNMTVPLIDRWVKPKRYGA